MVSAHPPVLAALRKVAAEGGDLSVQTGVSPKDPMLSREYLGLCGELWADGVRSRSPRAPPVVR